LTLSVFDSGPGHWQTYCVAEKLTLTWTMTPDGEPALVFDRKTWALFEQAAALKGTAADHFICKAIADALGTLVMDNYQENRGRKPWPEIDLSDELDNALQPWTCPQCKRVYQPPVTTYISPVDGRERCASCANENSQ
jgi:hypothetical protein